MTRRAGRAAGARGGGVVGERWEGSVQEVFLGLREWRAAHPTATLAEIEAELDRRLARFRARLVEDLALASAATAWGEGERPPACPDCGGPLAAAGLHERSLVTLGDAAVTLARQYATCPACGGRLFPPGRGAGAGAE